MFLGSFDHVLDDKGRTSLPKDFREFLAAAPQRPILTAKPDCLAIYPADEFQRILEEYADLNISARERLERLTIGNATRCQFDKQGRIHISAALRRLARLEREIMILGVRNRIEIWDRRRYSTEILNTAERYDDLTENLRGSR